MSARPSSSLRSRSKWVPSRAISTRVETRAEGGFGKLACGHAGARNVRSSGDVTSARASQKSELSSVDVSRTMAQLQATSTDEVLRMLDDEEQQARRAVGAHSRS